MRESMGEIVRTYIARLRLRKMKNSRYLFIHLFAWHDDQQGVFFHVLSRDIFQDIFFLLCEMISRTSAIRPWGCE